MSDYGKYWYTVKKDGVTVRALIDTRVAAELWIEQRKVECPKAEWEIVVIERKGYL
jgi:hypothetical protein